MILAVVVMIRNEADIACFFLDHLLNLFDDILVIDVCSTDGTREILDIYAKKTKKFQIYSTKIQEKFQSAYITYLSSMAFESGADWVFFLDGDEFLNVSDKSFLISELKNEKGMLIQLPWINLIPTKFGNFETFNIAQEFLWRGRVSKYSKVAISRKLYEFDSNYLIDEGSHNVLNHNGSYLTGSKRFSLLHLPIRSIERLKYKITKAYETLITKGEARKNGEGSHVIDLYKLISDSKIDNRFLQYLAAYYAEWDFDWGLKNFRIRNHWPRKKFELPYPRLAQESCGNNLSRTIELDREVSWNRLNIDTSAPLSAILKGREMNLIPTPLTASGKTKPGNFFKSLNCELQKPVTELDGNFFSHLIHMVFKDVDAITFSAWSELVPLQFAIFTIMRPRRYVELGAHNGMSFFAACQARSELSLECECVAIDSWKGDEHASFYSEEVFEKFKSFLGLRYPEDYYIRSYFSNALDCFETGSVDLLHIDGLHTYEAVREDFESWLPKMSSRGVIIFHDTNVYKTGFGVWRLWNELKNKYPSYEFKHSHGLGILYVGNENNIANQILDFLNDPKNGLISQSFFESLGELSIKYKLAYTRLHDLDHSKSRGSVPAVDRNLLFQQSNLELKLKNFAYRHFSDKNLQRMKKIYRYFFGKNTR